MRYGYIRVSTKDQNEDRQVSAMGKYGIGAENIYIEKASGKTISDRPIWKDLLAKVIIGDTIVFHEFDRLGRNVAEIKETYKLLSDKGVFIKMMDNDMLSTEGKSEVEMQLIQPILIHLLGYMAEKEREKILKRQKEGIQSMPTVDGKKVSKKTGVATGRPNKQEALSKSQELLIKAWLGKEIKLAECIKETGLSRATLYRIKAK